MTVRIELSRGDVVNEETGIQYHSEAGRDEYFYPDYRCMLRNGNSNLTRHVKRKCVFICGLCGAVFIARLDSVRTGARKSCGCAPRGLADVEVKL